MVGVDNREVQTSLKPPNHRLLPFKPGFLLSPNPLASGAGSLELQVVIIWAERQRHYTYIDYCLLKYHIG